MRKLCAFFLVFVFSLTLSGCFLLPKEEELPKLPIVTDFTNSELRKETVRRGNLELSVKLHCYFLPADAESLSYSQSAESMGEIYVKIGDMVKAGDLVAELVDEDFLTKIESVEAEMARLDEEYSYYSSALYTASRNPELSMYVNNYTMQRNYYRDKLYVEELKLKQLYAERETKRLYAGLDGLVTYVSPAKSAQKNTTVVTITSPASGTLYSDTPYSEFFKPGDSVIIEIDQVGYDAVVISSDEAGVQPRKDRIFFTLKDSVNLAEVKTTAEIQLLLDSRSDVLYLPSRAVINFDDKYAVYLENDEGFFTSKFIEVGLDTGDSIEIISGLEEGESVVLGYS